MNVGTVIRRLRKSMKMTLEVLACDGGFLLFLNLRLTQNKFCVEYNSPRRLSYRAAAGDILWW